VIYKIYFFYIEYLFYICIVKINNMKIVDILREKFVGKNLKYLFHSKNIFKYPNSKKRFSEGNTIIGYHHIFETSKIVEIFTVNESDTDFDNNVYLLFQLENGQEHVIYLTDEIIQIDSNTIMIKYN
jgi:hypothetical protein